MAIIATDAQGVETPIPHEPDESMHLRELTWETLQNATQRHEREAISKIALSGIDMKDLPTSPVKTQATPTDPQDVYDRYDKRTILEEGIGAWSYPEAVTPEMIARLDHRTADWAFKAILDINMVSKSEGED